LETSRKTRRFIGFFKEHSGIRERLTIGCPPMDLIALRTLAGNAQGLPLTEYGLFSQMTPENLVAEFKRDREHPP
jgi:hypothetical protein